MAPKIDLVQDAKHVAGMASQGQVTEDFAVRYLANIVGPDAIPLVAALLERAAELAANPPKRPVRTLPDNRHFTTDA